MGAHRLAGQPMSVPAGSLLEMSPSISTPFHWSLGCEAQNIQLQLAARPLEHGSGRLLGLLLASSASPSFLTETSAGPTGTGLWLSAGRGTMSPHPHRTLRQASVHSSIPWEKGSSGPGPHARERSGADTQAASGQTPVCPSLALGLTSPSSSTSRADAQC